MTLVSGSATHIQLTAFPIKSVSSMLISLQPFTANSPTKYSLRSTSVSYYHDFIKLSPSGRNSGHWATSFRPNSATRSETTGGHSCTVGENDGVIIVDHGSRRHESNLMLDDFVSMFKERTCYNIVEPAHMVQGLLIPQERKHLFVLSYTRVICLEKTMFHTKGFRSLTTRSWLSLVLRKHLENVCSREHLALLSVHISFPLDDTGTKNVLGFLFRLDIPSLASEASKEHSNVPYIITAPLGLHELMVDIMNDRIKYCLRHVAGDVGECTVCAGTGKCRLYY